MNLKIISQDKIGFIVEDNGIASGLLLEYKAIVDNEENIVHFTIKDNDIEKNNIKIGIVNIQETNPVYDKILNDMEQDDMDYIIKILHDDYLFIYPILRNNFFLSHDDPEDVKDNNNGIISLYIGDKVNIISNKDDNNVKIVCKGFSKIYEYEKETSIKTYLYDFVDSYNLYLRQCIEDVISVKYNLCMPTKSIKGHGLYNNCKYDLSLINFNSRYTQYIHSEYNKDLERMPKDNNTLLAFEWIKMSKNYALELKKELIKSSKKDTLLYS